MKSVMIVDDERPARELLKMNFNWKEAGFVIVEEARNGKDAYEKYKKCKPDVIITDIQMPLMDGIELIEKIKKENEDQNFIILSCHESFQYAQKAIRMGVKDYLIKDNFSETELYILLKGICKKESNVIHKSDNKLDNSIEDNIEKRYFTAIFSINKLKTITGNKLEAVIDEILYIMSKDSDFEFKKLGDDKFLLNAWFDASVSILENINKRHNIIVKVKNSIENYFDEIISVGSSSVYGKDFNEDKCIEEAKQALKYTVFLGLGKIACFECISDNNKVIEVDSLNKNILKVQNAFSDGNKEKCFTYLRRIYSEDMQGMLKYNYLEYVNSIFYGYINYQIQKKDINIKELWGIEHFLISDLNDLNSVELMYEWIKNKLENIYDECEKKLLYSEHVKKAIKYIRLNYKDNELSVEDIANSVGVHKVYLSRIFKKDIGMSLNSYLNKYRVEIFIKLITEKNMKISEAAYNVGFNNAQNFYHAFKQITGKTPKDYLKSLS